MSMDLEIQKLEALGLHRNEATIYLTFLGKPPFSATLASRECNLSRPLVYRALEKLCQSELCRELRQNPRQFLIADPRLYLSDIINQQERKIETARLFLPELIEKYTQEQLRQDSGEQIQVIHDMSRMANLYFTLLSETDSEVLAMMKPPYHGGEKRAKQDVDAQKKQTLEKKIRTRGLYELEDGGFPFPELIEEAITNAGEEVRMIDTLPMKMMIFDATKVILLLPDTREGHEEAEIGLFVNNRIFSLSMRLLFELYWEKAVDFPAWKDQNRAQFEIRE